MREVKKAEKERLQREQPETFTPDERTGQMSRGALECRANRGQHPWTKMGDTIPPLHGKVPDYVTIYQKCDICGSTRTIQYYWPTMEIVSYSLDREDSSGYSTPPGTGRLPVADARRALILRVWGFANDPE